MSNKDRNVQRIVEAIKKAAKENQIEPHEVTKRMLNVSDWAFKQVGGLGKVKNSYFPFENKDLLEIRGLNNSAKYTKKLEKELTERVFNEELIKAMLSKVKPVTIKPYKSVNKNKIKRELNLVLSDLHFGSDINKEETGKLDYGVNEEARRLAYIAKEVMNYKKQHRDETKLNILLLGDLFQNQLHDPRDAAPLTEQLCRTIFLLNQFIAHMSSKFPSVAVYFNTGNHGRNTSRHHGRAVNQKWDSHETVVAFALKECTKNLKNVSFKIPKTPFVDYSVFGQKIFATHGDSVINIGYPGTGIKTGSLEAQINKINAKLKDNNLYRVFVCGHVHVGSIVHLSNSAVLLTNGALCPNDEYATSIGLMESSAGQMLFESVPNYPVGDVRYIKVGVDQDKDASLDKIIIPFSGM